MSETKQRARDMPQRWKWVTFPDRTSAMTTEPDGEWCKVEDVAAALEQARREGVEAMLARAIVVSVGWGTADAQLDLEAESALLLSEGGERRCILCNVPLVVGPPTCPDCGGHAWKEDE